MPRLAIRSALGLITLAAALIPRAVAFGQQSACEAIDPAAVRPAVEAAALIVVGTTHLDDTNRGGMRLDPEAYLKGPAQGKPIQLLRFPPPEGCNLAPLVEGGRVLLFIAGGDVTRWPQAGQGFVLDGGTAKRMDGGGSPLPESELVSRIRGVTEQFAVPAATKDEGAGIDWVGTVLPVTGVVLAVFVIGLYLMRIWHRIDPS